MSNIVKPKVLVVCATKHGATAEIASYIADVLHVNGLDVSVDDLQADTLDVASSAGVVIGSAVYAGHWRKQAKKFVERHCEELSEVPVWLFSSGPLGTSPKPEDEPVEVAELMESCGALGHVIFEGRLDQNQLNLTEKAMVRVVHAPYGDYRDWHKIGAWASEIASYMRLRLGLEPQHPRGPLIGRTQSSSSGDM